VPAGFAFLFRNPRLWPLAALPVITVAVAVVGGLLLGLYAARHVEGALVPDSAAREWYGLVLTMLVWLWTPVAGMFLGLVLALLLLSPILERISRRVEARVRGEVADRAAGLRWEIAQTLRSSLYFLAAAPGVLLFSLVPVIGPPLGALWGAHALAFQQTDAALARRGLDFSARRRWHRTWRAESLGFGLAGFATLFVPFAAVLLAPVLAIGGTLLVLQLEEDVATTLGRAEPEPPRVVTVEL
jgi:uncharacterized protein involved in cysteine biosynthesis